MIQSYTAPRKDESFYSLTARYLYSRRNIPIKVILNELFGSATIKASVDFAYHLETFCQNLYPILGMTPRDIIEKLTLFPAYEPFLTPGKKSSVIKIMMSSDASTLHSKIGINTSSLTRHRYPLYCPICANIDLEESNETYWKLGHQLPDVRICHIHKCYLLAYQPNLNQLSNQLFLYPYVNRMNLNEIKYPSSTASSIHDIVTMFMYNILKGNRKFNIDTAQYKERLHSAGFFRESHLDHSKLFSAIIKYFGCNNLKEVLPANLCDLNWIPLLVRRPSHYFHPLRHVLLWLFIDSLPDQVPNTLNLFGKGPWLCLNKVCHHYLQNVVTDLRIHKDMKSKRHIGTFTCQCGMIYTKSFLKRGQELKEFVRIKERGKLWYENFNELSKLKISFREMARRLGTDAKTISVLLRCTQPYSDNANSKIKTRDSFRAIWLDLLSKFDCNRIINARKQNPKLYAWLHKNDNEWLLATNQLYRQSNSNCQLRLDWKNLDKIIVTKAIETIKDLKSKNFKGRITKTLVAKIINYEKYIFNQDIKRFQSLCRS